MCNTRLAQKRPTKKPKGALSVKARAKREVSVKSKLPGAYIRRKKQKEKTHEVSERTHTLGLSLRGNPLSLVIPPFACY